MGLGARNGHGERTGEDGGGEAPSAVARAASAVGDQAAKMAESTKHGVEAVGEVISSAAQQMREKAHEAREQTAHAVDQVKEGAQGIGARMSERAVHTRRQATDAARQAKNKAAEFMHEQHLVVAGIGLAIGAALAAILPSSRLEDQLMGEASDKLKRSLGDAASEQLEAAKATAGRVAEEALHVAEREGLTPDRAAAKLRDLGERVTGTAPDAGSPGEESKVMEEGTPVYTGGRTPSL